MFHIHSSKKTFWVSMIHYWDTPFLTSLAKFGFFDLDSTVSAAFIFVLVEVIHVETNLKSGIQGIRRALEVLQYLIEYGNKAAEKRYVDVEQIY